MLELALRFVPIGGGNVVCSSKIMAILPNGSRAAEKILSSAKKTNRFISLANGKKCRSVILMDSGLVFSSRLRTETMLKRLEDAESPAFIQFKKDTKKHDYVFLEDEDVEDEANTVDPNADYFEDDTDEDDDDTDGDVDIEPDDDEDSSEEGEDERNV